MRKAGKMVFFFYAQLRRLAAVARRNKIAVAQYAFKV
jgi:hypothetical protein